MHDTQQPFLQPRRQTRQIQLGNLAIGSNAPISVQTMTKTDTRDVEATLSQIRQIAAWGCDAIRIAVPDNQAAMALHAICKESSLPIVADIHFDHRLALLAIDAGVAGLRINPGNIGSVAKVREVAQAAMARQLPIRVGVNAGSLEREILQQYGAATVDAMVASAIRHVRLLEDAGFADIKISVKASDLERTVQAYKMLAAQCDYPLHLGLTEAGTLIAGTIKSCAALILLLTQGIGDTIRVSLAESPVQEVKVGLELLRAIGLKPPGAAIIACPTCGRVQMDVIGLAHDVEAALEKLYQSLPPGPRPVVAVMGCVVNGPGEAREADLAVAGNKGRGALYAKGKLLRHVDENQIVETLLELAQEWITQQPAP